MSKDNTRIQGTGTEVVRQLGWSWARCTLGFGLLVLMDLTTSCQSRFVVRLPGGQAVTCELAITLQERTRGLIGHAPLDRDEGLLFLFEHADYHPFWMKGMEYAIDIIWLNEEGRVVHFAREVPACRRSPCPSYKPLRRARFVLEVRAGTIALEGLRLNDSLNGPWAELARLLTG